MKPLPLPVRVAAGLAVTAVDRARHLPEKLAELPVTMVSQALQLSMRLQQHVTELAIKGDDVLASFRPVEESPEWATFDEDAAGDDYDASPGRSTAGGGRSRFDTVADSDDDAQDDDAQNAEPPARIRPADPWAAEERALLSELDGTELDTAEQDTAELDPAELDSTGLDSTGLDRAELTEAELSGAPDRHDVDLTAAQDDSTQLDNVIDLDRGQVRDEAPAALPSYPELTVPQLRARLRRLDIAELTELLDYERMHANRPEFVGMLSRRISTLRDQR